MTVEMSSAIMNTIQLSFGPPLETEYSDLGHILRDAFQLYESGEIATCRRMMCARTAKTGKVVGFAIWTLEDTWTSEAIQSRKEEKKKAIPVESLPQNTDMKLWDQVWMTFEKMQEYHLKDRPRCHLEYLCIDANVQRSGAGTALIDLIRQDAGNRPIWLEAAATPSAVNFYKKLHFEDLGTFSVGDLRYTAMKLEPSAIT